MGLTVLVCFVHCSHGVAVPVSPEQKLCGRQWMCSDEKGPVAFMVESSFSANRDDRAAAAAAVAEMSTAAASFQLSLSKQSQRIHSPVAPTFLHAARPLKFIREMMYHTSNSAAAAAKAHDKIIVVYDTCKYGPPSPSVFNSSHSKPCGGYSSCDRLDWPPPIKTISQDKFCKGPVRVILRTASRP